MKGKPMEMGSVFWPKEETKVGDELCGMYLGLFPNNFKDADTGEMKKSAHFGMTDGTKVEVSAGQIVGIWASKMEVNKTYWITYQGKKKFPGQPQAAHQFDVCPDVEEGA